MASYTPKRPLSRFLCHLLTLSLVAGHLPSRAHAFGPVVDGNDPRGFPMPSELSPAGQRFLERKGDPRALASFPDDPASAAAVPAAKSVPTGCPTDEDQREAALCEAPVKKECPNYNQFSRERQEGGLGKEILDWPALETDSNSSNSEYRQRADEFIKRRKQQYLGTLSALHMKRSDELGLKEANEARVHFFEEEFGVAILNDGHYKQAPTHLIALCEGRRQISQKILAMQAAASSQEEGEADACAGAQAKRAELIKATSEDVQRFGKHLRVALDGGELTLRNGQTYSFGGFEKSFREKQAKNGEVLRTVQTKVPAATYQQLKKEWENLWAYKAESTQPSWTNGAYERFLRQLRQEHKHSDTLAKSLEKALEESQEALKSCGSAGSQSASAMKSKDEKESGITGAGLDDPTSKELTEERKRREEAEKRLAELESAGGGGGGGGGYNENTPPPSPNPSYSSPGGGAGQFLSDNWMWLAGGGALLGGGIYLYVRHQDKKRHQREFWNNDANFVLPMLIAQQQQAAQSGASSSPSQPSSVPPPGTRLILVSAVVPPSVGVPMSRLEVAMVDAGGIVQDVSGLAVEVSCLTPNPCSLTGGKSATSVGGKAGFDGLLFNQPHNGVILQFSAPGVSSVTTPSFNVGGTNRQ